MQRANQQGIVRRAIKAGSWYEANPSILDAQLTDWLKSAGNPKFGPAKAVITPHASYRYCGQCAAHAFKELDKNADRVFILGPSHYVHLDGIALSGAETCETPLGPLIVDQDINKELKNIGDFEYMSNKVDEDEHSLELQMPYIYKTMSKAGGSLKVVPMMVGAISTDKERAYGILLSKYLADPRNVFVISSDFCHWGSRFSYQHYEKSWGQIYQSIERLDKLGMKVIKDLKLDPFKSYLRQYSNTICGRRPIAVFLAAVEHLHQTTNSRYCLKFLDYAQSSNCVHKSDSSVSYAAGVLKEISHQDDETDLCSDIVNV